MFQHENGILRIPDKREQKEDSHIDHDQSYSTYCRFVFLQFDSSFPTTDFKWNSVRLILPL